MKKIFEKIIVGLVILLYKLLNFSLEIFRVFFLNLGFPKILKEFLFSEWEKI